MTNLINVCIPCFVKFPTHTFQQRKQKQPISITIISSSTVALFCITLSTSSQAFQIYKLKKSKSKQANIFLSQVWKLTIKKQKKKKKEEEEKDDEEEWEEEVGKKK